MMESKTEGGGKNKSKFQVWVTSNKLIPATEMNNPSNCESVRASEFEC